MGIARVLEWFIGVIRILTKSPKPSSLNPKPQILNLSVVTMSA